MSQEKLGKIRSQINLLCYFNNNLTVLHVTTWPCATICRNVIIIGYSVKNIATIRQNSFESRYVPAKFEDTKWVIRSCKSKDSQYNGQKKKNKKTNNDPQNWATRTPLKIGFNIMVRQQIIYIMVFYSISNFRK